MTRALGPFPDQLLVSFAPPADRQLPRMLWLDDPLTRDPHHSGPAAHLARLAERYPVPPGFVMSFSSFPPSPVRPSELVFAYRQLASSAGEPEPAVVVRALTPDSTSISLPGRPNTIANVRGVSAIAAAIDACASATARHDVQRSVIVQLMVHADVSVMAYSVETFTSDSEHVVISARWGLGMGSCDPACGADRWLVRVSDGKIVDSSLGDKKRMLVSATDGVAETAVPDEMRNLATLTDEQVHQVTTLCSLLRAEHGAPICLDAAFAGGWLSLLQCRSMPCNEFGASEPAA